MLQWEGRFTGIERVEYQIAAHYARAGAKFFAYNQAHRAYYEMPADTLQKFKDGFGGKQPSGAIAGERSVVQRALPLAKRIIPERARKAVKARLQQGSSAAAEKLLVQHPFQKGDVVLIGATFSDIAFVEHLIELRARAGIKLAHIVHDIVPIVQPQVVHDWDTAHFKNYYGLLVRHADLLLAISESTKRDIQNFCKKLKVSAPPIALIRESDEVHKVAKATRPAAVKADEKFMLTVSTIEVRKNHTLLYYAYKQGLREGRNLPNLIIVGRIGWETENIRRILATDPEVQGRIKVLTNIDTSSEMTWLFQNCLFTLQPAFYEGWGLTLAESAYYGKLCLSSDASSLPEIAGDLMDYYSPFDSRACLEKICYYIDNPKALAAKEKRIQKEYKTTSWDDTFGMVQKAIAVLAEN